MCISFSTHTYMQHPLTVDHNLQLFFSPAGSEEKLGQLGIRLAPDLVPLCLLSSQITAYPLKAVLCS